MSHAVARMMCIALTLMVVATVDADEQSASAMSEPLTPSAMNSSESDDKSGERGVPDGSDEGPSGPGGPGGFGGPEDEPGFGISWYPSASVSKQGTELGMVRNHLGGDVPVWFKGADAVMASFSIDKTDISGEALLPDTRRVFPSNLWRIQAGLRSMHEFSSGLSSMLMFDIESASDKPFDSSRDIKYTVGGFYQKPARNGRDAWMFGAIYSYPGWPNFPIPLVAYDWIPSERFHMSIGLPFSINWQATRKLNLDMSLNPSGADAIATYELSNRLHAYSTYRHVSDQYFLSDREDKDDAFFAIDQRLIIGLRRDIREGVALDFNAGYAFDRHYGEGDDEQDLRDRVNLESSVFLGARLIWEY